MVAQYTPKPLSERYSNRLTPFNYIADNIVPKWGSTFVGLVAGWFAGGFIGGATGAAKGRDTGRWIGSLLGGLMLGFFNWRKQAANEMDSAAIATQMHELLPMAMTNAQVKTEIAHTKDMLAYEHRENAKLKALAKADPRSPLDHAAAEPHNTADNHR